MNRGGKGWRIFTGDEIGLCLCYEMIERTKFIPGEKYAIINTLVCSQTAKRLAEAYKIDHFVKYIYLYSFELGFLMC